MLKKRLPALFLIGLLTFAASGRAMADVMVFAAASLTNALTDIGKSFQTQYGIPVRFSFASSGSLAKQIEQGAPADVFVSADLKWMDHLGKKEVIDNASRKNLLGNTMVVIAPRGKGFQVRMSKDFNFASSFSGKLCTGETESVPVGIYAKEALTNLGWWESMHARIVGTEDVRSALNLVERGECAAGIVYETDAKQSGKVDIVAAFPAETHAKIVYPFALVRHEYPFRDGTSSEDAVKFMKYVTEKAAKDIFTQYGFTVLIR
ncbi:molybdate ABC transporter substrate-binding protein [Candidatus Methylospira mobilis]|uniref:Molybdate-binding protein ModA n=1 Tax=Candidatus Methylospira mobilis TaxID=1808979 RepID=A0A5Q0BI47_9GAMM|nr:molybdate ABC transporter substrate-binding protein [Candidatus Methylospira mobilis]QFY41496.1 molybdate ABC transporter substrate-binding protein [Candidatus Methylospira mobilis]WNV05275.1 molybdate ABC transporter substrate-binding protein [Candidatus Methylospira mobilis]